MMNHDSLTDTPRLITYCKVNSDLMQLDPPMIACSCDTVWWSNSVKTQTASQQTKQFKPTNSTLLYQHTHTPLYIALPISKSDNELFLIINLHIKAGASVWVAETDSRSESGCWQCLREFQRKERDAEVRTGIIYEIKDQEDDTSKYYPKYVLYLWLSEFPFFF